jgi:hypothetical protein
VVLDGKYGKLAVPQPLYRLIVQVYLAHLEAVSQAARIHSVAMVLGCYVNPPRLQIAHRVVGATVPELELKGVSAEGAT